MYNDDQYYDDDEMEVEEDYTIEDALAALPLDPDELIVPAAVVVGLSNLEPIDLDLVRPVWEKLPADQRLMIMVRLAEVSEADYLSDYVVFAQVGYDDPLPGVRAAAIQAAWADSTLATMQRLMTMAKKDESPVVRAAAISQLGQYIQLGELDELDRADTEPAERLALELFKNAKEPIEVQRRALEAISRCSRTEINDLIREAYQHRDPLMRLSAVVAMGNTCDVAWSAEVLQELEADDNEMRYEAARAAGYIGIAEAVAILDAMAYDEDRQLQEVAIWSLGEIGGDDAIAILEDLEAEAEENDDEELADMVAEAMAMANFGEDMDMLLLNMQSIIGQGMYDEDEDFDDDDNDEDDRQAGRR